MRIIIIVIFLLSLYLYSIDTELWQVSNIIIRHENGTEDIVWSIARKNPQCIEFEVIIAHTCINHRCVNSLPNVSNSIINYKSQDCTGDIFTIDYHTDKCFPIDGNHWQRFGCHYGLMVVGTYVDDNCTNAIQINKITPGCAHNRAIGGSMLIRC